MDAAQWAAIDALIAERDPYCRGVVLLGLTRRVDTLAQGFARRAAKHDVPRLCRRPHDLPGSRRAQWLAGAIDDRGVDRARARAISRR